MIALFTSIYLIGAVGMGALVLGMACLGALFGSLELKAIFIAIVYAALWPLAILYGVSYAIVQGIRRNI